MPSQWPQRSELRAARERLHAHRCPCTLYGVDQCPAWVDNPDQALCDPCERDGHADRQDPSSRPRRPQPDVQPF